MADTQPVSNEEVKALLEQQLEAAEANVEGDGYQYQVTITSPAFEGLNTVKRHQMVYRVLNDYIADGRLHAVNIHARAPGE